MTLESLRASLAGRYTIERELGAGGMATVYLAHDVRHDRKVALKVLRPELAAILGAERFLHEIKTTANLQHPNILSLFDSGEADGTVFYVMPYVEGESLRDRLTRDKQLPVDDVVRIATEVADALEYAHRHGVVHRDIKPENILLHGGHALVADFGIALAASTTGAGNRLTETGMSLGTPYYMSPEQAMGERDITAKSDVYALGCVTYEMLVGDPPFTGSTAQAVVAKVLTEKPAPPSKTRETVSDEIDDAVLTALAKLPADRWPSAAAFAAALGGRSDPSGVRARTTRARIAAPTIGHRPAATQVLAVLSVLLALVAIWGWLRTTSSDVPPVVRYELQPAPGTKLALPVAGVATVLAISPDGRMAAFAAGQATGSWSLYLRNLDRLTSRALPGTEGALNPAFSPDGKWIAFRSADGILKKVALDGSSLTTLCPIDNSGSVGGGLTWISDREIVFAKGTYTEGRGLWRVSSDGGAAVQFSQMDSASGERLQLSPVAVDQGRLLLYSSTIASNADLTLAVMETASGKAKVLPGLRGVRAVGLVAGFLVYVRGDGALMAAPFDTRTLRAGAPLQVGDSIAVPSTAWTVPVSMSANGSLLYQHGGTAGQLVRVDPQGVSRVIVDSVQVYLHPRLSPDGRRLAVEVQGADGADIWIIDLGEHTAERLTREGYNNRPEWSPDGRRLLYASSHGTGVNALWSQPADGSASATLMLQVSDPIREAVYTPDGKSVVYRVDSRDTNRDIYLFPLGGDGKPVPILVNINDDKEPRVSPDSKWLAYVSNESGREEVYVRALSGVGGRVPVSATGGGEPLWSRDGKRLFYRSGARLLVATIATQPTLAVTARESLFEGPFVTDTYHPDYDVAPDGKSFVMIRPVDEGRQVVMVVNWGEELRRRRGGR